MGNLSDITTQGGTLPQMLELLHGPYTALDYVLSGPTGSDLETWLGTTANATDFDEVLASTYGAEVFARSPAAYNAIIGSSTAMNKLVASANAMGFFVRERGAMEAIAADATAMGKVAGSSTAMDAIAGSAVALDSTSGVKTAAEVIANSPTAMGEIGADAAAFANFVSGDSAAKAVASNASVMTTLLTATADLADLFKKTVAQNEIGSQGEVFSVVAGNDGAITKYVVAVAGGDASAVTASSDLFSNATLLRDTLLSSAATDAWWRSSVLSDAWWATRTQGITNAETVVETVGYDGGTILRHKLASGTSGDYYEEQSDFDVNVDGVSTVIVYARAFYVNQSSSYIDGSLKINGSQKFTWDADANGSPYQKYQIDVSNDSGTVTLQLRSYLRSTGSSLAGYVDFGNISFVA